VWLLRFILFVFLLFGYFELSASDDSDLGYGTYPSQSRSRNKRLPSHSRSTGRYRRPATSNGYSRNSRDVGNRKPASFGIERQRFGIIKGFYGDNSNGQIIGFNYGYCKDYVRDFGYWIIGNYNTYENNVSAIRVDFYGAFAPNRRLSLIGGLNFNQFMGKNLSNVSPALGFQMGADIHLDTFWGLQFDYHNIKGSVSTGYGSSTFEATGVELTVYINFF
jgi:hypothetical protein